MSSEKDERDSDRRGSADAPTSASSNLALRRVGAKDDFLRLMLFQPSREVRGFQRPRRPYRVPGHYVPLPQSKARTAAYHLSQSTDSRMRLESPAIEVMTDLRRVETVTIGRSNTLHEADQVMLTHRVRALFVVEDTRRILGIVTSTDILGEKPIQLTQQRGIHHDEVIVGDIMTPADRLEVIELDDVRYARVGDVVATLRLSGRQHALVVDEADPTTAGGEQTVCGIFSLTQIARQLGIRPPPQHDIARTFAEIEAAIAR